MSKNDQYYVIHADLTNNYPMMSGGMTPKIRYLYTNEFRDGKGKPMLINNRIMCYLAPENYSYEINLAAPIPHNPEYVDYHSYDLEQSVSEGFVKAFGDVKSPGIQFLQGTSGDVIDELKLDYYYLHCLQFIKCMDYEKSSVRESPNGTVMSYKKLVLDYEILNNISVEHRLIFWLWEDPMTCIVHQKFVDVYNEAGLKGARFVPIEKYNVETAFM
ncbi:MAG: hypothetical protein HRU38_00400 [Saccharospirillaceae bacterium]|nr:hypothetical protein [Saccharospirillaceae bacterium]